MKRSWDSKRTLIAYHCTSTARLHSTSSATAFSALARSTKHEALRFFFVREMVKEGTIKIHYVSTGQELADIGTQHLSKKRNRNMIDNIESFGSRTAMRMFVRKLRRQPRHRQRKKRGSAPLSILTIFRSTPSESICAPKN